LDNEWKQIVQASSVTGDIGTLDVANARLEPATYTTGQPYTGALIIPYTSGNGGIFSSGAAIASTGVTGLNATLQAGVLNYGTGELVFTVSGTPDASSPSTASFAISADLVGTHTGGTATVGRGTALLPNRLPPYP
jgi:hypothetical protein